MWHVKNICIALMEANFLSSSISDELVDIHYNSSSFYVCILWLPPRPPPNQRCDYHMQNLVAGSVKWRKIMIRVGFGVLIFLLKTNKQAFSSEHHAYSYIMPFRINLKGETFEVPEIVPFRLTHNMVNGMGPMGTEGLFRRACEVTTRLMRDQREPLMRYGNCFCLKLWRNSP